MLLVIFPATARRLSPRPATNPIRFPVHAAVLRRGKARALLLATIAIVACFALVAAWLSTTRRGVSDSPELLTTTAWKGPYDYAVVARGTVQSASNIEIRCDVRSRGGMTAILEVVAEGAYVKKGDTLVELDDSLLQNELDQQQILVSTRESLLATAENTLKAAEIAKTEYEQGLFVTQEKQILSELYLAEQARTAAQEALESTKVLFGKAIVTAMQVEAAYSSLDDATNKFDSAQTNLDTLRTLTKQKELTLLEVGIASAQAEVKAQQRNLQLEKQRLQQIKKHIAKCKITAPADGQVVYANEPEYYRSSTYAPFVVAPGSMVRERQTIIWLPNPSDMQINVSVQEARVTAIRAGQPVSIRVEALDEEIIEGEVTSVSQFAEPSNFFSNSLNRYATTIRIKNPSPDLRVGMNAEARIHVEQSADALQLPVQALAESQGHYFSLVKNGDEFETRELAISSINDQVATVDSGLAEGDEVVIHPRSAGELLKLPDLPDATPLASDSPRPIDPGLTDPRPSTTPTSFGVGH